MAIQTKPVTTVVKPKKADTALQKAYKKFFTQKLRKFNVSSPANIKDIGLKKQFFNEVKDDWQKRRRKIQDPEKLKSKYTNLYLQKVKRRFNIPKGKIESGMILEVRYNAMGKDGKLKPTKKYLVLVLHPNFMKYMHCLRIDKVKPYYTRLLAEKTGLVPCTYNATCTRLHMQQLLLEKKKSRKFYNEELKKNMSRKYGFSYRIFRHDRFVITSLMMFDWADFKS